MNGNENSLRMNLPSLGGLIEQAKSRRMLFGSSPDVELAECRCDMAFKDRSFVENDTCGADCSSFNLFLVY
jgi:hypothetical protein